MLLTRGWICHSQGFYIYEITYIYAVCTVPYEHPSLLHVSYVRDCVARPLLLVVRDGLTLEGVQQYNAITVNTINVFHAV